MRIVLGFGVWVLGFVLVLSSLASAQTPNWPAERAPRPLAPRDVKFPPYEVRTLANGMQVIAVLHNEQPIVSVRLLVRSGSLQDPAGKSGTAFLMASLLDQGTTTRSAQQIADQIDFIGGALGTGSNPDWTAVNVVVMKDSFAFGMDLLADIARNPAFSPEEIDRQKQQIMSALQVNLGDPDFVASVLFDRLVYGFHPYGLPDSGTPQTLASITRDDLQAYHRQHFLPNNMVLAVVGDLTSEEAFAGAERVFGQWPRGEIVPVKTIEPPPPTRRVIVVDKPDAVQTEIRVGQLAIPRKHADYMAWDLAVKILGGEGANRLHRVLRAERGLTYGASADTEARKQAGDYVAETDTRTETTGEALQLMIDEFARLPRERVFERELSDAQAYLSGSFPLTIETPNDIATQVLNVIFFELPVEEIGTFRERVQAVTPDDIQRVARQYIRTDRLSIVLVGNAKAFVQQLRQVGLNDFEVIPLEQLDLMSATLRTDRLRVDAKPMDPVGPVVVSGSRRTDVGAAAFSPTQAAKTDARAVDLLKRVIDAKGGLDALRKVRTVVAEAQTTFRMEQGTMASTTRTYVLYPDRFRVDATLRGTEVTQVFNAGTGWMRDPAGVRDVPPPAQAEMAASVRRDMMPLLIAAAEGKLTLRLLPEESRDGQVMRAIELVGEGLSPVTLLVNAQNQITRQVFTIPGPEGRSLRAEEVFSDYRSVDGVQVPFKAELLHDGRQILSRTLTSVTFNSPIDETLFARPN
jgi:zinc protease